MRDPVFGERVRFQRRKPLDRFTMFKASRLHYGLVDDIRTAIYRQLEPTLAAPWSRVLIQERTSLSVMGAVPRRKASQLSARSAVHCDPDKESTHSSMERPGSIDSLKRRNVAFPHYAGEKVWRHQDIGYPITNNDKKQAHIGGRA